MKRYKITAHYQGYYEAELGIEESKDGKWCKVSDVEHLENSHKILKFVLDKLKELKLKCERGYWEGASDGLKKAFRR